MKNIEEKEYLEKAVGGSFDAYRKLIHQLRGENGCPWDRAQTPQSLRPCMVDELSETFAGIDLFEETGNGENLCEELGDMLLHIVLIADMMEEQGIFSMEDIVAGTASKMLRRHPHVFKENSLLGWSDDTKQRHSEELGRWIQAKSLKEEGISWGDIKKLEKEKRDPNLIQKAKQLSTQYDEKMQTARAFVANNS